MGREIKRVPLDFDAPRDLTWSGYLRDCAQPDCEGCAGCCKVEPPAGRGWQMWQTVSQGGPVSPVFARPQHLAQWIAEVEDCALAAARAFVGRGWAPSFESRGFGLYTGVQVAAGQAVHIEHLERRAGNEFHPAGTRVRHLRHGVHGVVEHIIPTQCVGGTDERFYVIRWDRGLPGLLKPGDDPAEPMVSACRHDGFEKAPVAS